MEVMLIEDVVSDCESVGPTTPPVTVISVSTEPLNRFGSGLSMYNKIY